MKNEYCPTCGAEMKLVKVLDRKTATMKCEHCEKILKYSYDEDTFPKSLKSFNWGAFIMPNFWGFGNGYPAVSNILIALWVGSIWGVLLPSLIYLIVGLYFGFYWGFNGNRLSWKRKNWNSVDDFESAQKKWAIAGIVWLFLMIVVGFITGL